LNLGSAYRVLVDSHVFLETERLILRRFTRADADVLFALDDDPEVMRYINGGLPASLEEIERDDLPHFLRQYDALPGWGFWAAIERSTGAFLGWFHLRPNKGAPDDEPDLGYRLHRSAWGRGYATEGSRALIDKAFRELGARRVVANTMVVNNASWRVMEKSGMRRVRLFHADWPVKIDGDEHGDVEYAVTREEWLAGQSR
jgi:RimJ/RimL family protein N-acetyltransferase